MALDLFSDLLWGKPHPAGSHQIVMSELVKGLAAQFLRSLRGGLAYNVGAPPVLGGDNACLVEQPVSAGHGVEVHPQVGSQLAYGGELVSWLQGTGRDVLLDLFHNLDIYRYSQAKIDPDLHLIKKCIIVELYDCIFV